MDEKYFLLRLHGTSSKTLVYEQERIQHMLYFINRVFSYGLTEDSEEKIKDLINGNWSVFKHTSSIGPYMFIRSITGQYAVCYLASKGI